jgi:2-keto-4-pentenoate hydratase/2-oxohepta-3-ene-1,7-dioic acid hydratase in catechol pathway
LGPSLVPADEIADVQDLAIRCRVNGETRQEASTSMMIFPVATLISELSRGTTLAPGTVILTGTPSGVGMARTPPAWLASGDTVEVEIDGVGVLRNRVREE